MKDIVLSRITEADVLRGLSTLNITPFKTEARCIWFTTVCHCGDSHKLCMFRDSLRFHCYTSCGAMDIFELIQKIQDCSFYESVRFWCSIIGVSSRTFFGRKKARDNYGSSLANRKQVVEIQPYTEQFYPERILNYFERDWYCGAWLDEGISSASMNKFDISWYEIGQAVIIPHRAENGKLIGIRRRSFRPEDIERGCKYMPLILEGKTYAHALGYYLYGLYQNKEAIRKTKRIIITESEKSVMLSDTFYGEQSCTVATCGFNITNRQKELILQCGVEEVILAFDKDYDPLDYIDSTDAYSLAQFEKYRERIYSLGQKFTKYCRVYVLWDNLSLLQKKDSPFDRGKEVFEKLFENKFEIVCKDGEDI